MARNGYGFRTRAAREAQKARVEKRNEERKTTEESLRNAANLLLLRGHARVLFGTGSGKSSLRAKNALKAQPQEEELEIPQGTKMFLPAGGRQRFLARKKP